MSMLKRDDGHDAAGVDKRVADVRASLEAYRRRATDDAFRVGELLHEVSQGRYYRFWGYSSLNECIEGLLGLSPRTGLYLMDVYRTYILGFGYTKEELAPIGWAKLAMCIHIVTPDTVAWWVELCRAHPLRDVRAAVRMRLDEKRKEEIGMRQRMSFFLTPGQAKVVDGALRAAIYEIGREDRSDALECIAAEFLSGQTASGRSRLDLLEGANGAGRSA